MGVLEEYLASRDRLGQIPSAPDSREFARSVPINDLVTGGDPSDGDTFKGLDSNQLPVSIRDFAVDAPERSQGQWGEDSYNFEKNLIGDQPVQTRIVGRSYNREIGRQTLPDGRDVHIEKVRAGMALPYREYWDQIDPDYAARIDEAEKEAKAKRLGYYGDYADGSNKNLPYQYRRAKDVREGKDDAWAPRGEEIAQPHHGALGYIGAGLDYANNIVRSSLKAAVQAPSEMMTEGVLNAFGQAAKGERYVDANQLRDAVMLSLGQGKARLGTDNDGKWTGGDALDVVANLGIDIATDPLTYASLGVSAVTKILSAGSKAEKGVKSLVGLNNAAPAGTAFFRSEMAKPIVGTTMGTAVGFGATNENDPLWERIGFAAVGGVLGSGAAKGVPSKLLTSGAEAFTGKKYEAARDVFDDAYQGYANFTGRGVTEESKKLQELWAAKQDGTLAKKAREFADNTVPVAEDRVGAMARLKEVERVTAEKVVELEAPLRSYLTDEATKIVDYGKKFGEGPEEALRRQGLIEKVAGKISEVRLSPQTLSFALSTEQAGRKVVQDMTQFIFGGRAKALQELVPAEKTAADALMREGKEYSLLTRGKYIKEAGMDIDAMSGPALRQRVLDGKLSEQEWDRVVNLSHQQNAEYVAKQAEMMTARGDTAGDITQAVSNLNAFHDNKIAGWRKGVADSTSLGQVTALASESNSNLFNSITQRINTETSEYMSKGALAKASEKVQEAVGKWKEHNASVVEKYNAVKREVGEVGEQVSKDMPGLAWHTSDVIDSGLASIAEDFLKVQKVASAKLAKGGADDIVRKTVGEDVAYASYAMGMANKFVDAAQKSAMSHMDGYRLLIAKQPGVRTIEKVLRGYDQMTNLAKANMLYFSLSWLKNNYWDNLAKAYIEGGFSAVFDTATLGGFQKKMKADIWSVTSGKLDMHVVSKDLEKAIELGVLEGPAFNRLVDLSSVKELQKSNPLYESYLKNGKDYDLNAFQKLSDRWTQLLGGTVGRYGSYMESTARYVTYKNARDLFLKDPVLAKQPEQAAKMAADMVKKAFFDYGDVTKMEAATFKRMVPFYSFYSKNLPYWAGMIADPAKMARFSKIQNLREGFGHNLSEKERKDVSPYLLENYAKRVGGVDEDGNSTYVISPSFSLDDAVNWLTSPIESFKDKSNPLVKSAMEVATGEDFFSGGKLYPSQLGMNKDGVFKEKMAKKFLYSRGFKWAALAQVGKLLGIPEDKLAVQVDKKGNPFATSDSFVFLDKVFSTVFPTSVLDQIAGSVGKGMVGKETLVEMISNRLAPLQQVKVSNQQKAFNRRDSVLLEQIAEDQEAEEDSN